MDNRLDFLKTVKPFTLLPEEVLLGVVELLQEVRHPKEAMLYIQDESKVRGLEIIVEGEYETFFYDSDQNKRVVEYYRGGDCYGGISILLNRKRSLRSVIVKKGTVVYFLHRNDFKALCRAFESFFHYFTARYGQQMLDDEYAHFVRPTLTPDKNYIASDELYSRKLETVEVRDLVTSTLDEPIYELARRMGEGRVSCSFVTDAAGQIIGYVTDITLRDNVVARQVDSARPVADIVDTPIVSINIGAYIYEAILLMFRTKTRYLLVERAGEYIGFISRNKLLSDVAQSPFMFIQGVRQSQSVGELKNRWARVPGLVYQLLSRGVKAEIVNQVITTVADTIALKVIEGVIEEQGPPPAKFVFMVLGSEGRKEQTLLTDQDNAIIYEDKANEQRELVRDYFLQFASTVSDRLNDIGFSYCTGGFMAKNPKWTHSLSHWKRNYTTWMNESSAEPVMKVSTFFDCRYLYGEAPIMHELQAFLQEELQKPLGRFLHFMAKNALQYEAPLTFFRNFRTFPKGDQRVFDLKKTMTPIVDLVRVYALQNQLFATNTGERLTLLRQHGVFTEKEYQELLQSYYYLMGMRLKKQAMQIIEDHAVPDNYVDPTKLTQVEQVTLKEIFKVIGDFQVKIKFVFTGSM